MNMHQQASFLIFEYTALPSNSLHKLSQIFFLVALQLHMYMCVYMCTYIQHTSILLFLHSCYYMLLTNWCRKFILCYLLRVVFGCLFVVLKSAFIVGSSVNLERFHTVYTYFKYCANCFLATRHLVLCSCLENVLLCTWKLCLGYSKIQINAHNFPIPPGGYFDLLSDIIYVQFCAKHFYSHWFVCHCNHTWQFTELKETKIFVLESIM